MTAKYPFAGLDGDPLRPRLVGAGSRSARPADASLELGRRQRLERALLDALPDPTAVLDAQGRIVAVNRAWARVAAEHPADLALGPAAEGVRAVLGGELPRFRCRYLAPGGASGHEVTVLPLADAEGAVVTDRQAPAAPDPG